MAEVVRLTPQSVTSFIDLPENVIDGLTKRERYLMKAMRQAVRYQEAERLGFKGKARYLESTLHSANAWLSIAERER